MGLPITFRTFDPLRYCDLSRNVGFYDNEDGFSCAKVGAGTSGCTSDKCGTSRCYAG